MSEDNNRHLSEVGTSLIAAVDGLRNAISALVKRADRSEKRIVGIVFAIVLDLIFTASFALLYYQQSRTAIELADTRATVLCPLYSTLLGSYNPTSRAPGKDRADYENIFTQMRDSYQHLDCTSPLVPKPTPTKTPAKPPGN